MPIESLKGLKGLSGLSQQERDAWRRINASKLEGKSAEYEDRLYANQQFAKKFGMNAFKSYNKDQRDYIYKSALVNEAFTSTYSPYTDKKDNQGNYIVNPNKGMGNVEEFEKYFAMDTDSKLKLLESGWKPTPLINARLKQQQKVEKEALANQSAWLGAPAYAQGAALMANKLSAPIQETYSKEKNDKILEKIYADDLKIREKKLQPQINDYYLNVIGKLSDSEVKAQFMKSIARSDSNLGNSQFAAFFHDGKNIESEVSDFSIDDMRMYLAKAKVLTENLGVGAANDALNNYAKEYISNHQSKWTYTGLLLKDIGISTLSYTADKINGIRQLYDLTQGDSIVWVDNKGNVVAPNQVKISKDGSKYYINEDGKATAIKQTKMSVADLDYLGKDAQGNTRDAMWNNQFWSDAEQYGTLNWDEQRQYKKLGASPYKVVYKPGDDSDLLYQTAKMTSFAIADMASMAIPVGGEALGTAMQVSKAASALNKAANIVGKGIYYTSKATKAVQPTVGAAAIGHAYGRGVFGEALAQNMQQLEESTYTQAQKDFLDSYTNDKNFKGQIDKAIQNEFNKLKNEQKRDLAASEGSRKILDQELNDKVLMQRARNNVTSAYVNHAAKDIQNSDGYFDMVGKASESASNAAMTAAITDGAKYAIVNNFGYRKFLFNTAADRAASIARRLSQQVTENESKRLTLKSLLEGTAAKSKTLGKIALSQGWGGAWTNYTDEMQSWGGKQINQDRFSAYLNGFYNGQALDDTYSTIDALNSYFKGAMGAIGRETTTEAGIVGALGSLTSVAPNMASIATTFTTRKGREAWRKASTGEKVNMLISNGILNEYYGKVQGEKEIQSYVEQINKLLDEQNNFSILKDAVALDRASIDTSNQEDKNTITYLQAIKALSLLHQFQNDSGMQDQSDSRIKRWLKNKFGGEENTLGAVASQSTILTKALSEINDLANGNIDEETAKSYLSEYYAKHPTIEQSEETSRQALEDMSQNATTLQEAEKTWQEINSKLDAVEEGRGSKIAPGIRGKLLERAALDGFLSEKLDALEDKISGNKANTSREAPSETWGTKEAIQKQVLTMERTARELNKAKIGAKMRLDKATSKLEEYEESHDIENLDDLGVIEHQNLVNERAAARLQYEYTLNTSEKLQARQDKMKAMQEEETSRVLSKDEILSLPSEARARMLDEGNRDNYSKEQLEQIDALKRELTMKDPSLLQSIQDQARLSLQKNANASAYEVMLNNPEAAAVEFEAQDGLNATVARDLAYRRIGETVNNFIEKINATPNVSQDDVRDIIYKNLRTLNPNILEYLDTTLPNEKDLEWIASYNNEITKAKEWSSMLTDISRAIDQMGFNENTRKVFSDNIDALIDRADTKKEAMKVLEDVSKATNVSSTDQANFKKLLNIINGVEEQRNATTTETKEEKKVRQESQETQAKQEEKKIEDAENQADENLGLQYGKKSITTALNNHKNRIANHGVAYGITGDKVKSISDNSISFDGLSADKTTVKLTKEEQKEAIRILNSKLSRAEQREAIQKLFDNVADRVLNEISNNNFSSIERSKFKETQSSAQSQVETQSNTQEAYQETIREKSNEQNAQEVYTETEQERKNQEEANRQLNTYEQTEGDIARDKAIEGQRKEGVDFSTGTIDFESPNWEKQVEQAEAEGHKIEEGIVQKGTTDVTDQGNKETIQPSEVLAGNYFRRYDVDALVEDSKEVVSYGRKGDTLDRILKWFENAGIKLQEIVDTEVGDIMKINLNIHLLYVNPQTNATDDACFSDTAMLAVEYTDKISKIHNKDRGGVVTANGKQYLIIGNLGFNNREQQRNYVSVHNPAKASRFKYFTANPNERFYVLPTAHTEIAEMTSGRIVRQLEGDSEVKVRPVTELLSNANRNPKGLKLQDLKWGIMFGDGLHYINISSRNTVYPPRDTLSNLGAVFLLIEAANGNYIPAAIRPTMLSDLQDSTLKTQLNNLFNALSSSKYSERLSAINQLVKMLNINEEGDNILIGTESKATVSTVRNGTVLRTFNLNDVNFNRMDLINAIFELNPRINITLSTLSDSIQLKMYAEAGALNTDIAKLGTSNASYTVYSMDANGNPIKTVPIENKAPNSDTNSDLDKADYKKKHSVYYKGVQYREKNGKWYDTNWKEITDPVLLSGVKWTSYIRANDLTPNLISNDKYGNKNIKYYIINSDTANAKVIKVFESGAIAELNTFDSRTVVEAAKERELKAAREKAAREEKQRLENIENSMTPDKVKMVDKGEEVDLGETLTEEQIVAQESGNFASEAKPQPTDNEIRAQAMVDRITSDSHDITLDEKRGVYVDSTGKERARVTSVIQATEGSERFDSNSPWITPSTNIGIGMDNFVRDFFANKLGNLDSLHERYPNATTEQLQAFEKQLQELRTKFNKAGLTVVPRDVVVTGEVEVTDANGKKYKLPVAGTLDLLAYDREGNFYIFDMKTNRSAPSDRKAAKWNKQLSLYKQFLEEKYGINVKRTSIIPIEVSYPAPKGWRDSKTIYRADKETNQLYYQTDNGTSTLASETAYRDAKPILHPNIPITTSPVKVEYSLLTNSEKSLLSPVLDGTFNSSTGTKNSESKNKNTDINSTGNTSLAELQASANAKPSDISSILKNRNYSKKVREILKEKGFNGKLSEVEAWLKEHNMPISNIEDIKSWIDMLQNCR